MSWRVVAAGLLLAAVACSGGTSGDRQDGTDDDAIDDGDGDGDSPGDSSGGDATDEAPGDGGDAASGPTPRTFATFLGGGNFEQARDVTVDQRGNIIVVGGTQSSDFPTTQGA